MDRSRGRKNAAQWHAKKQAENNKRLKESRNWKDHLSTGKNKYVPPHMRGSLQKKAMEAMELTDEFPLGDTPNNDAGKAIASTLARRASAKASSKQRGLRCLAPLGAPQSEAATSAEHAVFGVAHIYASSGAGAGGGGGADVTVTSGWEGSSDEDSGGEKEFTAVMVKKAGFVTRQCKGARSERIVTTMLKFGPTLSTRKNWVRCIVSNYLDNITHFLAIDVESPGNNSFNACALWWLQNWKHRHSDRSYMSTIPNEFFASQMCKKAYYTLFAQDPDSYRGLLSEPVPSDDSAAMETWLKHMLSSYTKVHEILRREAHAIGDQMQAQTPTRQQISDAKLFGSKLPTLDRKIPEDWQELINLHGIIYRTGGTDVEQNEYNLAIKNMRAIATHEEMLKVYKPVHDEVYNHIYSKQPKNPMQSHTAKQLMQKTSVQLCKLTTARGWLVK